MGLPGDDEVDTDTPDRAGGTPESCLLDDAVPAERCAKNNDDDKESDSTAFESFIFENLFRALVVRFPDSSVA